MLLLYCYTAELRAELVAQLEREREMREHLEKQLNEEQKVRCELFNYFLFLFQTL